MNLRVITLITAICLLLASIVQFAVTDYEGIFEYLRDVIPEERFRQWFWLLKPLLVEVPISIFLFTLYTKQK